MSLIIARNFKRAKAQDAAAKDKAPDGWWEGKTIFAAFGWGKSVKGKVVSHRGGVIKLDDGTQFKESDAYDLYAIDSRAADSCAMDAKFKVGDKVRRGKQIGIVRGIEKEPYIEVKFTDEPVTVFVHESEIKAANSRAADAKDSISDKEREYTRLYELAQKNITFHAAKGDSAKVAEWKRKADEYKRLAQEAENAAEARNTKDSHAADYDPNPKTRGKDIEVFSAQATREEGACENMLRKVIADVEELVIKIHGPMSSWEEVIENSKMSPELPQAKKWSGTANRRYDYLLARERAISSILSELKRNHID